MDMDMLDIMDTDTLTDTDTMVTILESDLLTLSQQLKLKLMPSHGTDMDMDIVDTMDIPIDTADTVVTTGDRFCVINISHLHLIIRFGILSFQNFNVIKWIYNYSMSSAFSFANKMPIYQKK